MSRTLSVVRDRWSLQILTLSFLQFSRFGDLKSALGRSPPHRNQARPKADPTHSGAELTRPPLSVRISKQVGNARKQIAHLSLRQEVLDKFIFADFDDRTLKDIADQIASLKDRMEKAALRLAADM
jgi:hypothetical protein